MTQDMPLVLSEELSKMTLSFPSHFLIPLETHPHFPKAHPLASDLVYLHAKHIPMSWLTRPLLPIDRRAAPRKPEPPQPEKPYPTKEKRHWPPFSILRSHMAGTHLTPARGMGRQICNGLLLL